MQAGSPVKESSFLNRETTAEELDGNADKKAAVTSAPEGAAVSGHNQDGLPIRR